MSLSEAMGLNHKLKMFSQELEIQSRAYSDKRIPLVPQLRATYPDMKLPSNKDHRIVPVGRCVDRTKKEILMVDKKLCNELERIMAQCKLVEQEKQWLTDQMNNTKAFMHKMSKATKLRENCLHPSKDSPAIVRDAVQKQLLIQQQEMNKSIQKYDNEMIGVDISIKQLKEVEQQLQEEAKVKEQALFTDTVALSESLASGFPPPNVKSQPVLMPRSSWLRNAEELMQNAAYVFKNSTRHQVQSAAVRRSRGMADENFRLKLIEMINRVVGKSDLARPYIEAKLGKAKSEIFKAVDTKHYLEAIVADKEEPINTTMMQQMMRNQRPESEFVDDSASRAIRMEHDRWNKNLSREQGALNTVEYDLAKLNQVRHDLESLMNTGDETKELNHHVINTLVSNSPIPAELMDTVSPKKFAKARGGQAPSAHHTLASCKLATDAIGQRAVSALEGRMNQHPAHTTMPRLQKHVTQ